MSDASGSCGCAPLLKNRVAAGRSRRKAVRKAKCNGQEPQNQRLAVTGFIMVLTLLPAEKSSPSQVFRWYQYRQQAELAFKQFKSSLGAGQVPESEETPACLWMQAKILTSLRLERLLLEARFSPLGI